LARGVADLNLLGRQGEIQGALLRRKTRLRGRGGWYRGGDGVANRRMPRGKGRRDAGVPRKSSPRDPYPRSVVDQDSAAHASARGGRALGSPETVEARIGLVLVGQIERLFVGLLVLAVELGEDLVHLFLVRHAAEGAHREHRLAWDATADADHPLALVGVVHVLVLAVALIKFVLDLRCAEIHDVVLRQAAGIDRHHRELRAAGGAGLAIAPHLAEDVADDPVPARGRAVEALDAGTAVLPHERVE